MDLVKLIESFSDHLQSEIILNINPKYINKIRKFINIDPKTDQKYRNIWYHGSEFKFENEYLWKSLVQALELEYYEIFESLFSDYQKSYPLTESRVDQLLGLSAYIGNLDYINRFIALGANNYRNAMEEAVRGGNFEIVEMMIQKGATYYWDALKMAARGSRFLFSFPFSNLSSDIEILQILLKESKAHKSHIDYNELLNEAAIGGNIEILRFLLNLINQNDNLYYDDQFLDEVDYNQVLRGAAEGGNFEIFNMIRNLMKRKGIKIDYNRVLRGAAEGGNFEIFKLLLILMKLKGININYNQALNNAAIGGNIEIFKILLNQTEIDIDLKEPLFYSSIQGNLEIFKLLLILVKKNIRSLHNYPRYLNQLLLSIVIKGRYISIFKLLLDFMSNEGIEVDYPEILIHAAKEGNIEIFQLLMDIMNQKGIKYNHLYLDMLLDTMKNGHIEIVKILIDKMILLFTDTEIREIIERYPFTSKFFIQQMNSDS